MAQIGIRNYVITYFEVKWFRPIKERRTGQFGGATMEEDQAVHAERELDKFTLSITREDKRALKSYAARQDKTVAKVLREWIDEKCKGEK